MGDGLEKRQRKGWKEKKLLRGERESYKFSRKARSLLRKQRQWVPRCAEAGTVQRRARAGGGPEGAVGGLQELSATMGTVKQHSATTRGRRDPVGATAGAREGVRDEEEEGGARGRSTGCIIAAHAPASAPAPVPAGSGGRPAEPWSTRDPGDGLQRGTGVSRSERCALTVRRRAT